MCFLGLFFLGGFLIRFYFYPNKFGVYSGGFVLIISIESFWRYCLEVLVTKSCLLVSSGYAIVRAQSFENLLRLRLSLSTPQRARLNTIRSYSTGIVFCKMQSTYGAGSHGKLSHTPLKK